MSISIGDVVLIGSVGGAGGAGGGAETPELPSDDLEALWLASALSLDDGDPVTTWGPSVGSPGSLSGTGGGRPTYLEHGSPSGGACVEWDGIDDEMSLNSPAGLPTGDEPGTIIVIVSRSKDTGSFSHFVQYGSAGPANCRGLACAPQVWYCLDYQSELPSSSNDAPRHRRGAVLAHRYDGAVRSLWVDGSPVATDTVVLDTGSGVLHLGRSVYGGERASFRLMLVAIYSRALSDAEMVQVMEYARAVHGVQ